MERVKGSTRFIVLSIGIALAAVLMPITSVEYAAFAEEENPSECYQQAGDDCEDICLKECTTGGVAVIGNI